MADNNYYRPYLDDDEAEDQFEKEEDLALDTGPETLDEAEEARLAAEEEAYRIEEAQQQAEWARFHCSSTPPRADRPHAFPCRQRGDRAPQGSPPCRLS